jgi:hypothetical protein
MISPIITQFLNDPNIHINQFDNLSINDINSINIDIYNEENCILAENVAAIFSHPRAFDTGHTLHFDKLNDFNQHSFLNQIFAAKNSIHTDIIEIAKDIHLAYCHMWLYYRIKNNAYISDEFISSWEQLDEMRKREYVFIALSVDVNEQEETADAAERLLQQSCDVLLNEY